MTPKVDQVDHAKEFTDEKMRMATAKRAMTRKIKRLETVLTDFKELDALDTTNIEHHLYGLERDDAAVGWENDDEK